MKYSELFTKTDKTAKEYDSINATYLQKAGFIFQTMAGAYTFLPLGLRVLRKIEDIVRDEMDKVSQEVLMPMTSPMSLWEKTGRIETIDVQAKVVPANPKSSHNSDVEYVLNSTHEEPNLPIMQKYAVSYKDLPVSNYQIQTKFRNEARPKSGLLRGREFRMKDMYSYHADEADLKKYYELMKEVYSKTFERLGIGKDTVVAMASGGAFTDDYSHEFQTICETGEDTLFHIPDTDVYYNEEIAPAKSPALESQGEMQEMKAVEGKGIIGVDELAKYLNILVEATTKTLLFVGDGDRLIVAAVRGGYEINELKLKKIAGTKRLDLADAKIIKDLTGAEVGYLGPIGLPEKVEIYYDESTDNRTNFECGANKTNYHNVNVNWGRDLEKPEKFYDFKEAKEGDVDPESGKIYETVTASEVGNIFPLHTKYSDAFDYKYADENGDLKPVLMGCYGIGITRVMGVIVEKYHDDKGIIWPEVVAPFDVQLVSLGDDESVGQKAQEVYELLQSNGIDVLWDDRDINAGEKFADADLIGIPIRVVISSRSLQSGGLELKKRDKDDARIVSLDELFALVAKH